MDSSIYSKMYQENLLQSVVPFWLNNSGDYENGGYFTCLDTYGKVYDTDKFMWLQCRQIWCFSMLYNRVEKKQQWLDFAIHGAEFVLKHGRDAAGNWYFSSDKKGNPLVQPYNIFSDCFATMAFGQLYLATKNEEFAKVAQQTFYNILKRSENPKSIYSKSVPGSRPLQSFSLPMILCNLVIEIESLLSKDVFESTIETGIDTVMNKFYQNDLGLIVEHIQPDGNRSDSFEGRLINPGHGIEAMWFIMDLAQRKQSPELIKKAVDITISTLEYAWDEKYGGLFYFLDSHGHPPQQLEWDQKLWWVHIESLISLAKGYLHTNDQRCRNWYEKLHDYTWKHFVDQKNGEWFGYLNRQGEVLLQLKGGKWKGCFHVPRGLYQLWQTMDLLTKKSAQSHAHSIVS
jgi:N-acylglucosamine 2-epimerase